MTRNRRTQAHALSALTLVLATLLCVAIASSRSVAQGQPAAAPGAAAPAAPHAAAPPADASASPPAPAQPAPPPPVALPPEVDGSISRLVTVMEMAEKTLARMKDLDVDLGRVRDDVEQVIATSTEVADDLRPRLAEIRRQIDKLGPAPAKDQPPEAAAVTAERQRLANEAAALDGAIKTLEVTWVRARQTIDRITDLRLTMFARSLMERRSSPLFPGLWTDVMKDAPPVGRLVSYISSDWLSSASRQSGTVLLLLAAVLGVYAGGRRLAGWATRYEPDPASPPSFFERAAAASWIAPVRALPLAAAALIAYAGLDALGLLYYPSARIAEAVLRAVLIYAIVGSLIATVLAPREPALRLFDLADGAAATISRLMRVMAAIYAADLAITSLSRVLYLPLSVSVVQYLIASLAFAGLLIAILRTPFAPKGHPPAAAFSRETPRWLKIPFWVAAAGIIAAALLGYVALARFAAQQILMTGVVALVASLLYLAIRAFTRGPADGTHPVAEVLEKRFGLDPPRRQQVATLAEAGLTLLLAILALPVLLLQWGFSTADVRDWVSALLFGFEIGQFRISLARILIGLAIFIALLFLTRVMQRWVRETLLLQPRVDVGVANSVDTALGYLGTALAAIVAISYAGFDVTSLAIVAGALSVGIGFGLQSIVNNFVSGLILLVERPIKVGDWVVVGNEQGTVRAISVRSTEIETFDKASLIVPNAELVTGRVLNWTHRNSVGRIVIKFATSATADPRSVCAMLEEVARRHPQVLEVPKPLVTFDSFNAEELAYTVRVHVGDINRGLGITNEIRTSVFEVFRERGVALAQPMLAAAKA